MLFLKKYKYERHQKRMIYAIGHNITSALGFSSQENYTAVCNEETALKKYPESYFELAEPFFSSILDTEKLEEKWNNVVRNQATELTKLEKMLILSVIDANNTAKIDLKSNRTIFILSSTKGNVDQLGYGNDKFYIWNTAQKVCNFFGNENRPYVVSNACISGAAAQIEALRLLRAKEYDHAVVMGGDTLCKFTISGFQSFKALSEERCKPFDTNRTGLNLGEATATIIYGNQPSQNTTIALVAGANRNDARHISAPSIEAVGQTNALTEILKGIDTQDIAFVNAHGTATIYNDEMEMLALQKVGLSETPTHSLKAFFGHTLGASGVVESIISMLNLENGIAPQSANCKNIDQKHPINISLSTKKTNKSYCIKMLSGFGGTNAALLFRKIKNENYSVTKTTDEINKPKIFASVSVSNNSLTLNGNPIEIQNLTEDFLVNIYKTQALEYPKFFKMDRMSKAGFLAAEILLRSQNLSIEEAHKNIGIALWNRSSSSEDDTVYLRSIDKDNYFPSPAIFVYTLPNIVAGEIAIRNRIFGETQFYVSETYNETEILEHSMRLLNYNHFDQMICGWVEVFDENIDVRLFLIGKES